MAKPSNIRMLVRMNTLSHYPIHTCTQLDVELVSYHTYSTHVIWAQLPHAGFGGSQRAYKVFSISVFITYCRVNSPHLLLLLVS